MPDLALNNLQGLICHNTILNIRGFILFCNSVNLSPNKLIHSDGERLPGCF